MKVFLYRILFLFLLVFLQLSFFDILFPWFRAPLFLLGAVVVFTLVRGFPQVLFMTVPLTLLFDTAALGSVSWFSLYAVLFSYGISFLSRRLLVEHRGLGLLLYGLVSYGGLLLYQGGFFLVARDSATNQALLPLTVLPSGESLFFSFIFSLPMFIVTYFAVKRFEEHLEFIGQKQFLNVR